MAIAVAAHVGPAAPLGQDPPVDLGILLLQVLQAQWPELARSRTGQNNLVPAQETLDLGDDWRQGEKELLGQFNLKRELNTNSL